MKKFTLISLVQLFILHALCKIQSGSIDQNIVNANVERKIDISSHLVKTSTVLTLENKGSSTVTSFLVTLDPPLQNSLSFLSASQKDEKLDISATTVSGHSDKTFYRVTLKNPVEGGKNVVVNVEAVYSHALRPYPSEITQAEKQLVVLEANLYYYSPYTTTKQTTTVITASSNVESYTKTKPVSMSDTSIIYGPYENKGAFSEANLKVHEENNNPFLTVTSMERVVEVSHWGNIAVEEHVDMAHTGAALKGPFSRFDYQRQQDGLASIKTFKTSLPASARDVYYRDEIGNISTSHMRELDDSVEVELRPRFPLFGGWKTRYFLGYNVPSYEYLFYKAEHFLSKEQYALKMRFIDHIYDDMVVDKMQLKIILPEWAQNIQLKIPFDVDREGDQIHHTYLDTLGRPVVVLNKNNLVEQHIQDFELHYTFQRIRLLQEPMLVVTAFYLLFLVVIIYVRLDFAITKDEAKESRMRVAGLIEEVQSTHDRRSALYQSYDDAINKFKASKDVAAFAASRKKNDADYKQLTQQINNLQSQLKAEGSDASEKVGDLQRLDSQYKEQVTLAIQAAEKLVAGKMGRQQYLDAETATSEKCDDTYKKMETLRATL